MARRIRPEWSDILVDRIAQQDFVLFIGAGVSSNSANSNGDSPPRWRELIESLRDKFAASNSAVKGSVSRAIRAGDLLLAAELIERHCETVGRSQDFRSEIARLTDGGRDAENLFKKNAIHEVISNLFPRIIVTTNYDRILERHFQSGYQVLTYEQSDIANYVRQGQYVLIKLHGSVDDPAKMILTRMDFSDLRRSGRNTLDTLEALMLTKTALFVGYSMDDPDLRLLLENQFGAKGAEAGHYLLASTGTSDAQKHLLKKVYGVNVVEYSGDHYSGVKDSLGELADLVTAVRQAATA